MRQIFFEYQEKEKIQQASKRKLPAKELDEIRINWKDQKSHAESYSHAHPAKTNAFPPFSRSLPAATSA